MKIFWFCMGKAVCAKDPAYAVLEGAVSEPDLMHGAYPHQNGERVVLDIFKLEKEKKPQATSEQQYNLLCEQKNK